MGLVRPWLWELEEQFDREMLRLRSCTTPWKIETSGGPLQSRKLQHTLLSMINIFYQILRCFSTNLSRC